MLVKDVMSKDLACCTPRDSVISAAKLMKAQNVGAIPIVDDANTKKLVGIITDRDICVMVVAEGKDPAGTKIEPIMSKDLATVKPGEDLERCAQLMQEKQVRRIPVVDEKRILVGIVAQADIAEESDDANVVKETVERISKAA